MEYNSEKFENIEEFDKFTRPISVVERMQQEEDIVRHMERMRGFERQLEIMGETVRDNVEAEIRREFDTGIINTLIQRATEDNQLEPWFPPAGTEEDEGEGLKTEEERYNYRLGL